MTSKDHIKLAEAFKQAYLEDAEICKSNCNESRDGIDRSLAKVAYALKSDNPRFDTQHFVEVVTGQRELTSHPSKKTVKL